MLSIPITQPFSHFPLLFIPTPKLQKQLKQQHTLSSLSPLSLSLSLSLSLWFFAMEDCKKYQIPAFGYWDFSDDLPITQYFESARHAGLLRFSDGNGENDLYGEDFKRATANVIRTTTVSRPKRKGSSKPYHQQHVKEQKKLGRVCDVTEPPRQTRAPKAVDEDLYKIPPELLHQKPKRNKMLGFFSSCFVLHCIA